MMAGSADNGRCTRISCGSRECAGCGQALRWLQPAEGCGGVLTEDSSGRIVTGETGLAHTRTSKSQLESIASRPRGRARTWCCGSSGM
jgi:hypothetical protein